MKQIDAKPTDYRRQDPETGEMKYPVNKRLCRILSIASAAFLLWMIASIAIDGEHWASYAGAGALAFSSGWLGALSLRRPDW